MKKYVIIGNGAAGASAAEQIRAGDGEGNLVIFSREKQPFYYRPRLPEYLSGEMPLEKFTMHPLAKYEQWKADLRLGVNVISIDPVKREVSVDTQAGQDSGKEPETVSYDELLLASGSSCFIPPVEGNDKQGVFALRTLEDADRIGAASKNTKKAILVGGGLLGLETAGALIKLGLEVEVVEFAGRLLPRQMDEEGAALLKTLLESMGFAFRLAAQVKEISGSPAVDGLVLNDGSRVDGGMVIFSAGVRPNLELAVKAGLEIGKAVKVDEYMRTGIPGIWAAGDVCETGGIPGGLWPIAMNQGRAAGASMAGTLTPYVPQAPSATLKVAGMSLTSAGEIDGEGAGQFTVKRLAGDRVYRKIVLQEDVIRGFIFLGSTAGVRECTAAMNREKHLGVLAGRLDREDFDFSQLGN